MDTRSKKKSLPTIQFNRSVSKISLLQFLLIAVYLFKFFFLNLLKTENILYNNIKIFFNLYVFLLKI